MANTKQTCWSCGKTVPNDALIKAYGKAILKMKYEGVECHACVVKNDPDSTGPAIRGLEFP